MRRHRRSERREKVLENRAWYDAQFISSTLSPASGGVVKSVQLPETYKLQGFTVLRTRGMFTWAGVNQSGYLYASIEEAPDAVPDAMDLIFFKFAFTGMAGAVTAEQGIDSKAMRRFLPYTGDEGMDPLYMNFSVDCLSTSPDTTTAYYGGSFSVLFGFR